MKTLVTAAAGHEARRVRRYPSLADLKAEPVSAKMRTGDEEKTMMRNTSQVKVSGPSAARPIPASQPDTAER